jgi:hypothetical protein
LTCNNALTVAGNNKLKLSLHRTLASEKIVSMNELDTGTEKMVLINVNKHEKLPLPIHAFEKLQQ